MKRFRVKNEVMYEYITFGVLYVESILMNGRR